MLESTIERNECELEQDEGSEAVSSLVPGMRAEESRKNHPRALAN